MKLSTSLLLLVFATRLAADVPVPSIPFGNTSILVQADISNGFAPPRMPARIRVPLYESVTFTAPESWTYPIQWQKDGKDLAGETGRKLQLPIATPDDGGEYKIVGAPFPVIATPVRLNVVADGNLGNLSARTRLAAGDDVAIAGFVVTGNRPKQLLIRAVGPSLRPLGVTDPVAQPTMQVLDRNGQPIGFAHVQTTNYWPDLFERAGAFPLTSGETSLEAGPFAPGVYSAHVRDASRAGGTVLIEVYEIP